MEFQDWPSIFDTTTLIDRGLCPVTEIKQENTFTSHSLYYEIHGNGPEKIVFVMGLNSSSFAWHAQLPYFASSGKYTALVFDNRGCGYSGVPKGPFKTSTMAADVIALLDYIGWTEPRGIHIVGVSLGGMIAQELVWRIPERVASLVLGVTTPGGPIWNNFAPFEGVRLLLRATLESDQEKKIPIVLRMVFPETWLQEQSVQEPGRTNADVAADNLRLRFKVTKKQPLWGSIFQMCAALTHNVDCERLRKISSSIPKITLVTGDTDLLVDASNSVRLKKCMPEAELVQWTNVGHGIHIQCKDEFRDLVERTVKEGRERSSA
ncbi:alpha/beta-hydrolase [Cylindrobasidium torrendii FP15055 ss-10]|uniref:Alpha/beta-hydrolase n=1 Tax=Cylindrobasidium torrendii FP15055 ss-10 TaxID=1314674 RepID=A0A0D7B7N0_9AGAR|nr:alpha/beta-hydrolase [Cylindrobasidium torrendii FP15055 ss-10]